MNKGKRDNIFARERPTGEPFVFDEEVVDVFDDMLDRSVPLYRESLRRQSQLACRFYQPGTRIYDLGCSNGNFGMSLLQAMEGRPFSMAAVDSAQPMLESYRRRLASRGVGADIELIEGDIRCVPMKNASVVIINLTLQFLPPADRQALLGSVRKALVPGGVLLLSEKVVDVDPTLEQLQQDFYYRLKRENGYSELEISQKREALENVLVPETVEAHIDRLKRCGFSRQTIWLKWFNFVSILAQSGERP